jgi:ATP-dependent RNA helicase DeaD
VHAGAIPWLVEGRDAVLHSSTGSGKTLAYLLPLLARVNPEDTYVQCVVLAPSRELATQIASVADQIGEALDIVVGTAIGGANLQRQVGGWDTTSLETHVFRCSSC